MQFRPLDMWTGAMTKNRRRSTFKAPWMRTLRDLERETGHLKARDVVLSGAFRADQITQDNSRPRAGETPAHPGVVISFEAYIDGKYVPLKYPCDTFTDWQDNVRAIALALDALRRVDRYGVTKRAEQYRGWLAIEGPKSRMSETEARNLINQYGGEKEAIMASHPDRGGSEEAFHAVQKARQILGFR